MTRGNRTPHEFCLKFIRDHNSVTNYRNLQATKKLITQPDDLLKGSTRLAKNASEFKDIVNPYSLMQILSILDKN